MKALLLAALIVPSLATAEVYKCPQADGNILYKQTPCYIDQFGNDVGKLEAERDNVCKEIRQNTVLHLQAYTTRRRQAILDSVKETLADYLKRPDSVILKRVNVIIQNERVAVCGEYSAKNSFDDYTGTKRFRINNPGEYGEVDQYSGCECSVPL